MNIAYRPNGEHMLLDVKGKIVFLPERCREQLNNAAQLDLIDCLLCYRYRSIYTYKTTAEKILLSVIGTPIAALVGVLGLGVVGTFGLVLRDVEMLRMSVVLCGGLPIWFVQDMFSDYPPFYFSEAKSYLKEPLQAVACFAVKKHLKIDASPLMKTRFLHLVHQTLILITTGFI